jgi:hypothetical protein
MTILNNACANYILKHYSGEISTNSGAGVITSDISDRN